MQIDFHFYGIYFLCRAVGIVSERAKRIAYASQYVDDAKDGGKFKSPDGFEFNTVHSSYGLLKTPFSEKAQREIWLPFHFVPNVMDGEEVGEKIVTRPDSLICRSAMTQLRQDLGNDYKVGVFLHSWADTWAHQGFSARVGRENSCSDIICHNLRRNVSEEILPFLGLIFGGMDIDLIKGVGHGEASTCPDEPYLDWEYKNGFGTLVKRKNHDIFMQASETVFDFLTRDVSQNVGRDWSTIENDVSQVFAGKGNAEERGNFWRDLIASGNQFNPDERDNNIGYDEMEWRDEIVDKETGKIKPGANVVNSHWYQFNEAARWYKTEILKATPPNILEAVTTEDDFEVIL